MGEAEWGLGEGVVSPSPPASESGERNRFFLYNF